MFWSVRSSFPTIKGNKVTVSVVMKRLAMNCLCPLYTRLEWFLNILMTAEDVENICLKVSLQTVLQCKIM
jgi:hypothetical protein